MKSIGAIVVVVAISGCATSEKFAAKMDAFIGQSEGSLVAVYGLPQGSYALQDGARILQYTRSNNMVLPGATTMQAVTTNTSGNLTLNQGGATVYWQLFPAIDYLYSYAGPSTERSPVLHGNVYIRQPRDRATMVC